MSAAKQVKEVVAKLKANKSTRFSTSEYRELIYALIKDDTHTAKKFALKGTEIIEEDFSISADARKFFKKLLKHAGLKSDDEINQIIDTFEYSPNDLAFIADCVDEAIHIYTDLGKTVKLMKDGMSRVSIKRVERSGKYAGEITYRRSIQDLEKSKKRAELRGVGQDKKAE